MQVSVELWLAMLDHLLQQALLEIWLQVQQIVPLGHQIIKVSYVCSCQSLCFSFVSTQKNSMPNLRFSIAYLRLKCLFTSNLVMLTCKFQVIKGERHLHQATHKCRSGSKVQLLRLVTTLMVLPLQHQIQ